MRLALALLVLVLAPAVGAAIPPGPDPTPVDAYAGLLSQFERRPLVAFLEQHGSAPQHRFLRSLVLRPEFGSTVDAVVVEFGSARYQVTIDRYVRGERVPLSSLSKVWTRTTQDSGVWNDPVYHDFFRAVRAANAGRPRAIGSGCFSATRRSTGAGSGRGHALAAPDRRASSTGSDCGASTMRQSCSTRSSHAASGRC